MANYKRFSTTPMQDYSKRRAKKRKKNSVFGSKKRKKNGCYVATCVYGSYDCPQVWTLRRYRDYTLCETWYGRMFIRFYYAVSPIMVKWFGASEWFRNLWKPLLDRMVEKLNQAGVECTPYTDTK